MRLILTTIILTILAQPVWSDTNSQFEINEAELSDGDEVILMILSGDPVDSSPAGMVFRCPHKQGDAATLGVRTPDVIFPDDVGNNSMATRVTAKVMGGDFLETKSWNMNMMEYSIVFYPDDPTDLLSALRVGSRLNLKINGTSSIKRFYVHDQTRKHIQNFMDACKE